MKKRFTGTLGLIIGLLLLPLVAYSDMITFDLNKPNAGLAPYIGPYASITVNLNDDGTQATITETALNGYGIVDGGSLGLNVKGNYTLVEYTAVSPAGTNNVVWKSDGPGPVDTNSNVDGLGKYDLVFNQATSSNPQFSLTVVLSGKWTSASTVLALEGNGQDYVAAGHFLPPNSNGITGYATVPIPASAWLLGIGLVGLIGFKRKALG